MFEDMYSKRYNIGHKNCQDLTGTFKMGSLWFWMVLTKSLCFLGGELW